MSTKVENALRKVSHFADVFPFFDAGLNFGGIAGGVTGIAGGVADWIDSAKDPELRKNTTKRLARALAKGVLYGAGGLAAGYGLTQLGLMADKNPTTTVNVGGAKVNVGVPANIGVTLNGTRYPSEAHPIPVKLSK